jgi:pilus assembly protein CpaF
MEIKDLKKRVRREVSGWISGQEKLTREFITERAQKLFDYLQTEEHLQITADEKTHLIAFLCDDFLGWGPLQTVMTDEEVTEIMINGPYKVYIEKSGKKILSEIKFDDEAHLRYIVQKMLSPSGRRVDESSPYVDFSLDNGSRVNVILPPLAFGGAVVTIRKFLLTIKRVEDLVRLEAINEKMGDFLVAAIKAKTNILFSGATGSGKTTTLEVLSSYANPSERIITIEDTLELTLRQEHVVRLLTRPPNIEGKGEVTIRDLFRNTLRMRPTRIILGEIRGEEAIDYLQALNSGHRGALAVIHASSPHDALGRLETMVLYAGLNIPTLAIRGQISSGLDLIVQQEQLLDGSRKITHITEVGNVEDGQIALKDIYRYDIEGVSDDFKIQGRFRAYGKPGFFPLFIKKGISLPDSMFED